MFKNYRTLLGSDAAALWILCFDMGYPFRHEAFEKAREKGFSATGPKANFVEVYINEVKRLGFDNSAGAWESDRMLNDLIQIGTPREYEEEVVEPKDFTPKELRDLEEKWGAFSKEDYIFLERTFKEYTDSFLEMDTAMTRRYQDLCKAELMKRKADAEGNYADIKTAQTILNNTLAQLKLDNFDNGKKSEIENFVERKAWMIENTRPAECEDLEKYKDFSGFGKLWEELMRVVRNLVAGTKDYPDLPKDMK